MPKNRIGLTAFLSVMFLLGSAAFAFAHEVTINYPAKLGNGPELQPGTYRVEVVKKENSAKAVFSNNGKVVVQVPIKLVEEPQKSRHTAVHWEVVESGRVITQIRLEGQKEALVFQEPVQEPAVVE